MEKQGGDRRGKEAKGKNGKKRRDKPQICVKIFVFV